MDADVTIILDGSRRRFSPGDAISGSYVIDGVEADAVEAVECSIVWHTEGKADEDLGAHYFERRTTDSPIPPNVHCPGRFRAVLPASPLSYDGMIVKVRWSVRARVFLTNGEELLDVRPFQLGELASARSLAR